MAKFSLYVSVYVLISLKLIWTAELQKTSNDPPSRKRIVSDPVSNFFSELGDIFVNADKTFAVQTAPQVEFEDGLVSRLLGPLQPRKEYFERIQENYKTLQNRLGSTIADVISERRNGAGRKMDPFTSVSLPDAKSEDKEDVQKVSNGNSQLRDSFKQSQSRRPIFNAEEQMRAAMERIIADTRRTGQFLGSLETLKPLRAASSLLTRRSGDTLEPEDNSDPQGRIIGDNLFSESRFDQYLRQLLRNHGRWILDNPLFKGWRSSSSRNLAEETAAELLSGETEMIASTTAGYTTEAETMQSTEIYENELPRLPGASFERRSEPAPLMSANYYRIANDGDVIDEVQIVLQPESNIEISEEMAAEANEIEENAENEISQEIEEELEAQDTVILAFTNDGVPLKLRMGPEIENPIKFLHRVLRTAGVTLKIPVESYEDLEPVGKEVLLLGAGTGTITRAVYLDLSNPNELQSLLRTLMKLKVSEMAR